MLLNDLFGAKIQNKDMKKSLRKSKVPKNISKNEKKADQKTSRNIKSTIEMTEDVSYTRSGRKRIIKIKSATNSNNSTLVSDANKTNVLPLPKKHRKKVLALLDKTKVSEIVSIDPKDCNQNTGQDEKVSIENEMDMDAKLTTKKMDVVSITKNGQESTKAVNNVKATTASSTSSREDYIIDLDKYPQCIEYLVRVNRFQENFTKFWKNRNLPSIIEIRY